MAKWGLSLRFLDQTQKWMSRQLGHCYFSIMGLPLMELSDWSSHVPVQCSPWVAQQEKGLLKWNHLQCAERRIWNDAGHALVTWSAIFSPLCIYMHSEKPHVNSHWIKKRLIQLVTGSLATWNTWHWLNTVDFDVPPVAYVACMSYVSKMSSWGL